MSSAMIHQASNGRSSKRMKQVYIGAHLPLVSLILNLRNTANLNSVQVLKMSKRSFLVLSWALRPIDNFCG